MIRPFVMWPDPRLMRAAEPVGAIDDEVRSIWDSMIETMDAMPGVGLAAPQIGVLRKLAVVDASASRGQAVRLADPVILHASAELRQHVEASPNLPGISARIARPAWVVVGYRDDTGAAVERTFEDLWATSVQHQIDHLCGMVFLDRLSPLRRRMALKRARKRSPA